MAGGTIEDIDWRHHYLDYRDAKTAAAKESNGFPTIYTVVDGEYIFYCSPYAPDAQKTCSHPCFVKYYEVLEDGVTRTTYVHWDKFVNNHHKYLQYASANRYGR